MTQNLVPQKYVTILQSLGFKHSTPTFEQVFTWFKLFDYYILVLHKYGNREDNCYRIYVPGKVIDGPKDFKSYEEAEIACLLKLIELKQDIK